MAESELLPIKVVIARKQDYSPPDQGRSPAFRPIVQVTASLRESLQGQVQSVCRYFRDAFQRWPTIPAVARVALRKEAYAKSKRPIRLFHSRTCPIIGGNQLGELYVRVTEQGLDALGRRFGSTDEKDIAHISTIFSIDPFDQEHSLGGQDPSSLIGKRLRLRLFVHDLDTIDQRLRIELLNLVPENEGLEELKYPGDAVVWQIRSPSAPTVATLAGFPGTRLLSEFPTYRIVRTTARVLKSLTSALLPSPVRNRIYPLVGMIDTGTDPDNTHLQEWVHARLDLVPRAQQDNTHGSFVAGLISQSRLLNHNDQRFPSCSARVVDVVAFDKDGEIDEWELIYVIRDAVKRFHREVRIWNLSCSIANRVCLDHEFSPVAMLLDELSREYGVLFIVAAGNTDVLCQWPHDNAGDDSDRICSPADSAASIVVGGIAHLATPTTLARQDEPSPFTRRGPGAAYLVAPQLVHVAGNCDASGDYTQTGVISVDGSQHLAEAIGTSFATPIISSLAANVASEIAAEESPTLLTRALMMHSALLSNAPLEGGALDHVGVGKPPDLNEILFCRQDAATAVIRADLGIEPIMIKENFPIPSCLIQNGSLYTELLMTLVYLPPFDANAGFEYCQTNVDAHLGTLHPETGAFATEIPTIPKSQMEGWERQLVKYGYKWSPIKFYYRHFSGKNRLGDRRWELRLDLKRRLGIPKVDDQHIAYLIITLRDKQSSGFALLPKSIYDEWVTAMGRLGWGAVDLGVRSRQRARP